MINPFYEFTKICICPNCNTQLHFKFSQNIYSGGPWACGRCNFDVTEAVYGKKKS